MRSLAYLPYHFHETCKLVHDSSEPIWHVAHLNFHDSGPLPLATSWIFRTNSIVLFALRGFRILNFSPPRLTYFAFLLLMGSSFFCFYLETCILEVDSSFLFHYSTSKPETSIVRSLSSLWLLYIKPTTQTHYSWNAQSHEVERDLELYTMYRSLWNKVTQFIMKYILWIHAPNHEIVHNM